MPGDRDLTELFEWATGLLEPEARRWVDRLDARSRLVAGYQFGWWDAQGVPSAAAGKAIRPTLVLLCARAVGGRAEDAVPAAVGVELVHNFSILHDDVMDNDRLRRHRPAAWTVFGIPSTVDAADALMSLAFEIFFAEPGSSADTPCSAAAALGAAIARMVRGQALDLAFEDRDEVTIEDCLSMAADKTASLFAASARLGALYGGAEPWVVDRLTAFGEHLGRAFQLTDDILGIWGTPDATGKPVLSDLRARKKSAPVVAALGSGQAAAGQLGWFYAQDWLEEDDLREAASLVEVAGGLQWVKQEADSHLGAALALLKTLHAGGSGQDVSAAMAQLGSLATFLATRQH